MLEKPFVYVWYACPSVLRVSQAPRLDLDKLYEEITLDVLYHNDFRPQAANSPQKKDNSSSRYNNYTIT